MSGAITVKTTGLMRDIGIEVQVVRSATRRKCSVCGHKRVLYALLIDAGGPVVDVASDTVWLCAPDAGLR